MATKKASPAQIAARQKFAEMARSGAFKKRKSNPRPQYKTMQAGIDAAIKRFADSLQHWINEEYSFDEALERVKESSTLGPASIKKAIEMIGYKTNPRKKTVSQKISQLTHEGYPHKQAIAVALSEQRAGKVKKNPINEQHLFGNKYATIRQQGDGRFVAQIYEKVKTGIGEEIDLWGFKIYKTQAGAQKYLESLKPVKKNPTRQHATRRSAVMPNPIKKRTYEVYCQAPGQSIHSWTKLATFHNATAAKQYAKAYAKMKAGFPKKKKKA